MTIQLYYPITGMHVIASGSEGCYVAHADHLAAMTAQRTEYMNIAASVSSDLHKANLRIAELEAEVATLRAKVIEQPKDCSGDDEYMCPNCCTPWKCNGPHIPQPAEPVVSQPAESAIQELADIGQSMGDYDAPEAYLVTYREVTKGGQKRICTIASLEPLAPTIWHDTDENIESRELISAKPLVLQAEQPVAQTERDKAFRIEIVKALHHAGAPICDENGALLSSPERIKRLGQARAMSSADVHKIMDAVRSKGNTMTNAEILAAISAESKS